MLSCINATPIRGSTPSSVTVSSRWGKNNMRFPSWKSKKIDVIKSLTICSFIPLFYLEFLFGRVIIVTCDVFLNILLYRMEELSVDSTPPDTLSPTVCTPSSFELSFSSTHVISSIFFPRRTSTITIRYIHQITKCSRSIF